MLNSQDFMDRQILAAVREYHELRNQDKRYTVIKLDEPIQRGWRRFYALTERALAREDRPMLEAILEKIGSEVVHHRADFRKSNHCGSRRLIEMEQPLKPIPVNDLKRVGVKWEPIKLPDGWRCYFHREMLPVPWFFGHAKYHDVFFPHQSEPCWVFSQPSLFELKVEKNWQWYYDEIDPEIETRISELDRWLTLHGGWHRYRNIRAKNRYEHTWKRYLKKTHARQKELCRIARQACLAYNAGLEVDPKVWTVSMVQCFGISPQPFGPSLHTLALAS